jgi:hypothetical protein
MLWPAQRRRPGSTAGTDWNVLENDSIHHHRDTSIEEYITRDPRTHRLTYLPA